MPDIQYYGHRCFRIRAKEGIVVTDPVLDGGLDATRTTAHIVTLSVDGDREAAREAVKAATERVFVVEGPGEYEVGGVLLNGVRTYRDDAKGQQRGRNTIYVVHLDDLVFCHLGDLGHTLSSTQIDEIGSVDVLFCPAGSNMPIAQLTEVISEIEPRLLIPMYEDTSQLERFTHELGLKEWTPQEKLTTSGTTMPPEGTEMRVAVLQVIGR
ncbi:MAG: MBL fold metallo-hydrolase [Herpetosiphon sp.]